jgi:predicted nucleotidyltransferase
MTVAADAHLDERTVAFVDDVLAAIDVHAHVLEAFVLGSAALGGFDPATSDLDLVVVVEEAPRDRGKLLERVSTIARPVRDLELVVYVDGSQPPDFELNVNGGEEHPEASRFWFVIDAALAQERGVPGWRGRAWSEFFERVAPERIRKAMQESLEWSAARPADDDFARANAARARHYLEHAEWITKEEATR